MGDFHNEPLSEAIVQCGRMFTWNVWLVMLVFQTVLYTLAVDNVLTLQHVILHEKRLYK